MEEPHLEKSLEKIELDEKRSDSSEKRYEEEPERMKNFLGDAQLAKKNKDDKSKKKDEKNVEHVLKALSSLGTSEEKLAALCIKYSEVVEENKKLQVQMKQYDKKLTTLQREKEQLQAEQGRSVLTRSRLESLCRELQKQNKQIKEESLQRIKEEEEKRKAVSSKFQSTLSEITLLMQQNNENNSKLRDENLEMQNKFKAVCEQYELRGQQVEKMTQQMKLESQLAEAKLNKLKIEMGAEKEFVENEKKQLLIELAAYQHKCQELQKAENALKNQISMYTEKYNKFQGALAKSNELYGGFKAEMAQMSNKICKLEKETSIWKMRWEKNHKTLLQVAGEKQQKAAELCLAAKQLNQLQKLCRTLQADRSSLMMQLKTLGVKPKLSGDNKNDTEENSESQPDEKSESTPPADCKTSENGNAKDSIPVQDEVHLIHPIEAKECSPETDPNEDVENEKEGEIQKTEVGGKTKKGKEGSKRRKK